MSGTSVSLEQLDGYLRGIGAAIDWAPLQKQVSLYLTSKTLECFAGESTPDGQPWPQLAPGTRNRAKDRRAAKKGGSPKMLQDTGALRASYQRGAGHVETFNSLGNSADAASLEMTWGSALSYAEIQNSGGTVTIPEREQVVHFRRNKRTNQSRFSKEKQATHARKVKIPQTTVTIPARQHVGLTSAMEDDLAAMALEHVLNSLPATP